MKTQTVIETAIAAGIGGGKALIVVRDARSAREHLGALQRRLSQYGSLMAPWHVNAACLEVSFPGTGGKIMIGHTKERDHLVGQQIDTIIAKVQFGADGLPASTEPVAFPDFS